LVSGTYIFEKGGIKEYTEEDKEMPFVINFKDI